MTDDLIVLWRSEVEALRDALYSTADETMANSPRAAAYELDELLMAFNSLLADAPAVVDAGEWFYGLNDYNEPELGAENTPDELVCRHGIYRVLLIEEGDE